MAEQTVSQFTSRVFALRPDGQAVALALDGNIWLLKPDVNTAFWLGRLPLGTQIARVTWGGQTVNDDPRSRWIDRLPTWLPDGRLIYLRSTRDQNPDVEGPVDRELWIAGSSAPRKLANLTFPCSVQSLLPDPSGTRLLGIVGVYSHVPEGTLWLVDLRTGVTKTVPTRDLPAAPVEAVWSPDRKAVALAVPKENWLYLYRLDVESGALRKLSGFNTATNDPNTPPALTWPPGSNSLLVHIWDPRVAPGTIPPHAGIYRVPIAGGDPMQVVQPEPGLSSPKWSPDGRWVAYLNRIDGYRYALYVASGRTVRLGGWSRQEPYGILFQWGRDSRDVWYPCLTGLCRTTLPSG